MIEIINIRQNNEYCYTAMLQGHDMKRHIIKPKRPVAEARRLTEEQYKAADQSVEKRLKESFGVKG